MGLIVDTNVFIRVERAGGSLEFSRWADTVKRTSAWSPSPNCSSVYTARTASRAVNVDEFKRVDGLEVLALT